MDKRTALDKLIFMSLLRPKQEMIGGIPVLIDNAYFTASNNKYDVFEVNTNYFLTGWFDMVTPDAKIYTFGAANTDIGVMTARWFNDKSDISVDYWRPNASAEKTITSGGRFIVATVYKPTAADYYLFNATDNVYVFKGSNVT